MIKALPHIIIIGMILLCPAISRAQRAPVTHNFHDDSQYPAKLRFENGAKTGVTPLLTYTCSNNAVFGTYKVSGLAKICLKLDNTGDFVTTTAVDSLTGITVLFYPENQKWRNVRLQLSRDSIHWSDSIVSDMMYNSQAAIIANFVPGRYYVRLTNEDGSKPAALRSILYSFGDCNCVLYIPEE